MNEVEEIKKALCELIYFSSEARRDLTNKDACKKCSNVMKKIIELSEPRIANIYLEMKKRGTKTGCPECIDATRFSLVYLLLLELGEKYI